MVMTTAMATAMNRQRVRKPFGGSGGFGPRIGKVGDVVIPVTVVEFAI